MEVKERPVGTCLLCGARPGETHFAACGDLGIVGGSLDIEVDPDQEARERGFAAIREIREARVRDAERIEGLETRVKQLVDENAGMLVALGEVDTLRTELEQKNRVLKDASTEMEKMRVRAWKAEDRAENLRSWIIGLVLILPWVPTLLWWLWKIFS